jgi:hypothetical protein
LECLSSHELWVSNPAGTRPRGIFQTSSGSRAVAKVQLATRRERFDRQYVPQIFRQKAGNEKIDAVFGVRLPVRLCLHNVPPAAKACGALYLHSPETMSGLDNHVIESTVSPRFRYSEAQGRGFAKKGCLPEFLGGGDADGLNFN